MKNLHLIFVALSILVSFSQTIPRASASPKMGRLGSDTQLIRELIARKQWSQAARKITRSSPEAQFVRGALLLEAKDYKGALDAFERAVGRTQHLNDFVQLKRAEAFVSLDRPKDVMEALGKVKDVELMGSKLHRMRAWAARETGQIDSAKVIYNDLLKNHGEADIPIALLGLARLAHSQKQYVEALDFIKRLDVDFPAHWTAKEGRMLALAIVALNPKLMAQWTERSPEEKLARGEAYLKKHRNQAAIRELTGLNESLKGALLRCRQEYALGRALRKRRKWKRARPILTQAIETCTKAKSDLAPWAIHLAGRAAETVGNEDESARIFGVQIRTHPKHRLADDAAYFLVRDAIEDRNDLNLAEERITKYVRLFPDGDMMADGVFFVVAHAFEKKQFRRALRVLNLNQGLKSQKYTDSHMGRSQYWRARILDELGRRKEARTLYRETMTAYPLSWYAFLAYSRLREWNRKKAKTWAIRAFEGAAPQGNPYEGPNTPLSKLEQARWQKAKALAFWGLAHDAWQLLRRGKIDTPQQLWAAAKLLDDAGAVSISHDILRRRLSDFRTYPSGGKLRRLWTVAYPRPFSRLVRRAAKDAGVPTAFVSGVIREESGFNAGVESFANAVGLMQLLVPTGKMIARKGEGKITRERLQNPILNVTLGSRFLAHVHKTSGAAMALVPPGYNAGPGATKRWLKKRGHLPLDLFVELIPYKEARDYTKKVNASYGIYRFLYESKTLLYVGQNTRSPKARKTRRRPKKRSRRRRSRP